MASMDAQQIYDNFHVHAKGTQGLATAADTAAQLAAKYQNRAVSIQQVINGIRSGWRGSAAEAASQGLAPLAENSLNSHQRLGTGQDIVSRQVESFHTAAAQVQPVPAGPAQADVIDAVLGGQLPQPIMDQMMARQTAQQANVDAYNRYLAASQYNTANVPILTSIDTANAPISVARSAKQPTSTSRVGKHASTRRATTQDQMSRYTPARGQVRGTPSRSAAPHGIAASGTTTPSAGSTAPGTNVSSVHDVSGPVGSGSSVNAAPPSGGPVVGGGSGVGAGVRLFVDEPAPVAGEPEVGGPRSGVGSPPVGRPTSGRVGAPEEGAASTAEEPMVGERVGGVRSSTPGVAGPVGGRRRGGGDAEHKRRYGLPEDGEERFGIDGLYAPPVIGETATEREQRDAEESARHLRDR